MEIIRERTYTADNGKEMTITLWRNDGQYACTPRREGAAVEPITCWASTQREAWFAAEFQCNLTRREEQKRDHIRWIGIVTVGDRAIWASDTTRPSDYATRSEAIDAARSWKLSNGEDLKRWACPPLRAKCGAFRVRLEDQ